MKELKDYSDVELKALGFDCLVNIKREENNLQVINQELVRRQKPPVEPKTDAS